MHMWVCICTCVYICALHHCIVDISCYYISTIMLWTWTDSVRCCCQTHYCRNNHSWLLEQRNLPKATLATSPYITCIILQSGREVRSSKYRQFHTAAWPMKSLLTQSHQQLSHLIAAMQALIDSPITFPCPFSSCYFIPWCLQSWTISLTMAAQSLCYTHI